MKRTSAWLRAAVCALAWAWSVGAQAGGYLPCRDAHVFQDAAVSAFVLPYRTTTPPRAGAQPVSMRLASLIQQEVLFSMLKYGSIGATELFVRPGEVCDVREVIDRVTHGSGSGTLRPGHALVVLWGRIYEDGNDVYVQSYVRFLRRDRDESIDVTLNDDAGNQLTLTAPLPDRAVAMKPRRLTQRDVAAIEARVRDTLMLHASPDANAARRPLQRSPDEPLAYGVIQTKGDWMQIRSMLTGESGWVRARTDDDQWALRRFMPELGYLDGVIGYLRLRTADVVPLSTDARRVYAWSANGLTGYYGAGAWQEAPEAAALARALQGVLMWTTPSLAPDGNHRQEAARLFDAACDLTQESSGLRTLAAVTAPWLSASPVLTREALARVDAGLLSALAVDQKNAIALRNLERVYTYAIAQPEASAYAPEAARQRLDLVRKSLGAPRTD